MSETIIGIELSDLLRFMAADRTLVALAWTRRLGELPGN